MEAVSALRSVGNWFSERLELGRIIGASNLRPMEGLRGVAVLLVFAVHYATLVAPWAHGSGWLIDFLQGVHAVGNAGVDLFFVLSGFLIYGGLVETKKPFVSYLRRRIRRIYPAFLAVFALYLVLALARGDVERMPSDPAAAFVYVLQNLLLLPGLFPIEPLITVAWSLSYELFFYLLVPAVVALTSLRARGRRWRIAFILVATGVALIGFGQWGGPVRLTMFLAGMLLHELLLSGRPAAPPAWLGLLCGLGALAITLLALPGPALQALRIGVIYLGFLGLCFSAIGQPHSLLGRALSWTPLRWMGNISYSYYLLHGLALQVFFLGLHKVLPPVSGGVSPLWLMFPAWLATLPPCLLLFLLIERPFSLMPTLTARGAAVAREAAT